MSWSGTFSLMTLKGGQLGRVVQWSVTWKNVLQDALCMLTRHFDGPHLDGLLGETTFFFGFEVNHSPLDVDVGDVMLGVSS